MSKEDLSHYKKLNVKCNNKAKRLIEAMDLSASILFSYKLISFYVTKKLYRMIFNVLTGLDQYSSAQIY